MLKIAVFAPIPRASVKIAMAENAGLLTSWRKAKRMSFNMEVIRPSGSFGSQGDDWIDTRSAAGWHAAGNQRDHQKRQHRGNHSADVDGANVVKQRHQSATGSNCPDESDCDANSHQRHALAEYQLENVCALRAERHADAELPSTLCDRKRHHPVKTDAREH